MTRLERRLLLDCLGIGVAITLLVIAADASGLLTPLENALYDARVRRCQFFTPPPTDKLVHLDLDDRSLEVVGARWPWPRARWAQIFDELRRAQPKAVEMDLLLSEAQDIQFREISPGKTDRIDNDRQMAESLGRAGNVILPLSIDPKPPPTRDYLALVERYVADPNIDETELAAQLKARGIVIPQTRLAADAMRARREAIFIRVRDEIRNGASGPDDIRKKLLPQLDPEIQSPIVRQITEQFDRLQALAEFSRFSYPVPQGDADQIARGAIKNIPLRMLSENAAGGAFVDYPHFAGAGAVVRTVPLLIREHDSDRVYAQMGLRLACRMLDVDPNDMRITPSELRVGRGEKLRIPLGPARTSSEGVRMGALLDIPWTGSDDWQTMYDYPAHRGIARHMSINFVWEAVHTQHRIAHNFELIDEGMRSLYAVLDPAKLKKYEDAPPADLAARGVLLEQAIKDAQDWIAQYKLMKPEEIDELGQRFVAATSSLPNLVRQTGALQSDLQKQREELSTALKDKAVLIGWIATGFTDVVPTPLHERCPGVVVHGAIFNGIMTGEMWRSAPWWISALLTGFFGLTTASTTARLAPLPALFIALLAACGLALFNGIVLFDYFNLILPLAATLVTIALTWGACTMTRVIIEGAERRRITGRFRNYVDPKLVNYVLEHPEVRLDGEKREMTVVFTDLAGFTSLSEKLGEKIVPLLNELLGELVPVIRDQHTGLVNKFLGDGIMFFYNAPKLDPNHASDAVATVLDMHAKVAEFNLRLKERGLPEIYMRAGICTGEMIVGDAGGAGAADYTVLGDAVNLGARLEPANKQLGTRTLITARTAELVDGQFILRAVGKIRVVGKDEAVMTYEPLARAGAASDEIKKVAFLFKNLVEKNAAREFHDSLAIADDIDSLIGPTKLVQIYRDLAKRHIDHPPADDFDGRIILTEK